MGGIPGAYNVLIVSINQLMQTTTYYIYGARPVFAVQTDGIRRFYAFQWETGRFVEDISYFRKISHDLAGEAEMVTKNAFGQYVAKLKREKGLP